MLMKSSIRIYYIYIFFYKLCIVNSIDFKQG